MRDNKLLYLTFITLMLILYYLVVGITVHFAGYYNHESLFYIEKSRIIFDGIGNRLQAIGLTSPIIPFYCIFPFISLNYMLAPIMASSMGMGLLFLMICSTINKQTNSNFLIAVILAFFLFHPGFIFAACSGKSIYLILVFFFAFFYNIIRFYNSNTTFHVSIASILLVILVFCDYKFIWMTLFFIPLIISIAIQSLNLSEKQSIFRLFLSFNNPSLRRKLVNKTMAMYVIIFILPLLAVLCYKLINQAYANDYNYFNESPYASFDVFLQKYESTVAPNVTNYHIPEISFLTSIRVLLYCPLIFLGVYLFRKNTQYLLTILIPFGFVEFLKIKYPDTFLAQQYYLIFIIMAMLTLVFKSEVLAGKNRNWYKVVVVVLVIFQIITGYTYLRDSFIESERNFVLTAENHNNSTPLYTEYRDMAQYINQLPKTSSVLIDDANAYPIVSFITDIHKLILPYQTNFVGAIENPSKFVDYVLIASDKNNVRGFSRLNTQYKTILTSKSNIQLDRVYESDNWILYRLYQ
jgi:hypothetical protein